jgi:hypothetical protein
MNSLNSLNSTRTTPKNLCSPSSISTPRRTRARSCVRGTCTPSRRIPVRSGVAGASSCLLLLHLISGYEREWGIEVRGCEDVRIRDRRMSCSILVWLMSGGAGMDVRILSYPILLSFRFLFFLCCVALFSNSFMLFNPDLTSRCTPPRRPSNLTEPLRSQPLESQPTLYSTTSLRRRRTCSIASATSSRSLNPPSFRANRTSTSSRS